MSVTTDRVVPPLYEQLHQEAIRVSVQEAATLLQDTLTRRVTAYVAGVADGKTVTRWVTGDVTEIKSQETEQRLRRAYEIARLLLKFDSPNTVRAWFTGMNPHLDDASPAQAIRDGKLREAMTAARSFVAGG